ncbi:MAG: rhamnose/proton symporter RhaT [Kiritimatiellae bacterium]|nr:rhamnose/proton symporter RhaT [Kiritimatiellia bacterium]
MDTTFLGMIVFALGGLAGATFLIPARGIRGWAYETWWFFYVLLGLIVCPPIICYFTVPDFFAVTFSASPAVLLRCAGFGMMWGVGALAWGLMVRYLGIGLGLAIGCGLAAAAGTLIPPIAKGQAGDLVKDANALIVLGGVIGSLLGIVFVGLAGKAKEGEMPEEEKKKAVAEFDFKKGIVTAVVAGVFSAGMNFGLQSGGEIQRLAVEAGAKELWSGMPVIMVVLWGGFIVEALWCFQQHVKNRTFGDYARPSLRNFLICASIGILWLLQFIGVKAGEPLVAPEVRYISFAVMMASTIFFSTLAGVLLGEWKGTGAKTKGLLALGTLVLIASFCAISIGSK